MQRQGVRVPLNPWVSGFWMKPGDLGNLTRAIRFGLALLRKSHSSPVYSDTMCRGPAITLQSGDVSNIVEREIRRISDSRIAVRIRELAVTPYPVERSWDYGEPGERYTCWTILEQLRSDDFGDPAKTATALRFFRNAVYRPECFLVGSCDTLFV